MGHQQRSEEPVTATGDDCTRVGVVVRAVSASERPFGTRTDELA
jgi:hypothetical protein